MKRIQYFRKEPGRSQLELAKTVEISRQSINMIENNKCNPSWELCLNLAHTLQTDLNSLFWESEKIKPS